jgi:hypothetical protein
MRKLQIKFTTPTHNEHTRMLYKNNLLIDAYFKVLVDLLLRCKRWLRMSLLLLGSLICLMCSGNWRI